MAAMSANSRRWVAGLLKVARAAAFLTLATGINGTVAALYPRYEPIYVYLVAVVIVAWLGGALLGVTAAVAAVILYDWMFAPVQMVPSIPSIVPLVVAITAAIVTRLAKVPIPRRQVAPAPIPILLPPIDASVQVPVTAVPDPELIATYERRIADARQAAEKESRLRAEASATAKLRETQLSTDAEAMRNAAAEQMARAAAARRELEAAAQRVREAETRITALSDELNVAYRRSDEEKSRADRETRLREQLESAGHVSLQKTIADLSRKNETVVTEARNKIQAMQQEMDGLREQLKRESTARQQLETVSREAAGKILKAAQEKTRVLQRDVESAGQELGVARTKAQTMQQELDAVHEQLKREIAARQLLESSSKESSTRILHAAQERARVLQHELDSVRLELQREIMARRQHEASSKETAGKTVADMATKYGSVVVDLEERVKTLTARSEALEQQLQAARKTLEEESHRADREHSMRDDLEVSMQHKLRESEEALRSVETAGVEKLQMAIANLSERYESRLAEAMNRAAEPSEKVEALEKELAAEREARKSQAAENDKNLGRIVASLTADYEDTLGDALVDRESARAEVRNLTKDIYDLSRKHQHDVEESKAAVAAESARADQEQQKREALAAEFDKNVQQTLAGLTNDFEETLASALVDRAGSRAEIRDLTNKLQELQKKMGAASSGNTDTQRVIDDLRAAEEKERTRADNEKVAREKLDMEWTEKLNKIVTHLATDHEQDLGEALVEKEGAKAETRTLNLRLNTLQHKLEQERQAFRLAREKWLEERAALMEQVEPLGPTASSDALAGDVRGAIVLVVHSDAGIRAMSKHALEQAGYVVLTAADGLEGMRMAASQKPDVVLAEAVMPKMNGRELVQLLKSRRETADVKIILMSSGAGGDVERGSDFRADEQLHDPADFNLMRSTLANVLAKRGVSR